MILFYVNTAKMLRYFKIKLHVSDLQKETSNIVDVDVNHSISNLGTIERSRGRAFYTGMQILTHCLTSIDPGLSVYSM